LGERLHRDLQPRLRDELLDGEIFYSLAEAKIAIEAWRRYYNTERPHGSLSCKPPTPEVVIRTLLSLAGCQVVVDRRRVATTRVRHSGACQKLLVAV
jgi:hypothetical protein